MNKEEKQIYDTIIRGLCVLDGIVIKYWKQNSRAKPDKHYYCFIIKHNRKGCQNPYPIRTGCYSDNQEINLDKVMEFVQGATYIYQT